MNLFIAKKTFCLNFFVEMYILGDGRDLTRNFENQNFTYITKFLSLRLDNRTVVASFLNSCKPNIFINHGVIIT